MGGIFVRLFMKSEFAPPFVPTPELVYTLSADGTYYIVGTGFASIEAINADTSGGTNGSGLNSSWTSGEVNIPAIYNGKPVKAIAPKAFLAIRNMTKFNIQDGQMTTIGHRALQCDPSLGGYDTTLTEVHLPNTLVELGGTSGRVFWGRQATGFSVNLEDTQITSIGLNVFASCTTLASIIIPNGVTSIGQSAFSNCENLVSITIPDGVTSIGSYAFSSCDSLASVTIGSGVTSIGDNAFAYTSLASITIPSGVTRIGNAAFFDCRSLATFNFDGTISQWNSVSKGGTWKQSSPFTVVHCTDGDVGV